VQKALLLELLGSGRQKEDAGLTAG
jgi:hypothetical protein